jgi:hypothetical protein
MDRKNATLFILILCALVIFLVTSCEENRPIHSYDSNKVSAIQLDNNSEYYNQHYRVYTLEGCEYIVVDSGNMKWGGHKGNCKNPIHKNTQDGSN